MNVPEVLGDWQVRQRLGAGGSAQVHLATHCRTGMAAVVKVMRPALDEEGVGDLKERMRREAGVLASCHDPRLPRLIDINEQDGLLYLVMQRVEGSPLSDRLRLRPLSEVQVWRMASDLCQALQVAAARGVHHRDIKPANIMWNAHQSVLIDWGIATAEGWEGLTDTRIVVGTMPYLAPETLFGSADEIPATARDVFALGVVCAEALTGKLPFSGGGGVEEKSRMQAVELPEGACSPALRNLIRRCTEAEPRARPGLDELERIVEAGLRPPPPSIPAWLLFLVCIGCSLPPFAIALLAQFSAGNT
ncbi:MAG TPA: serine/threonine-protein kinase [Myxococcota bacterium]|nr:serine/threonine-protein kinase [Myxococcota bacterium]HND32466.1 serine/threonine-protein kinase [Myxococcota bacterium]HNH47855.1 serine/threonine-protein kinase [Myxococcota bacterium]